MFDDPITPSFETAMNDVPDTTRVIAHSYPTLMFRVLMLEGEKTFRVEQLDTSIWKWRTLSTHSGDEPWESYGPALQDAIDKQDVFEQLVIQQRVKDNHARRLAAASASNSETSL